MEPDREEVIAAMENALFHLVIAIAELREITVDEYAEEKLGEYVAQRLMDN